MCVCALHLLCRERERVGDFSDLIFHPFHRHFEQRMISLRRPLLDMSKNASHSHSTDITNNTSYVGKRVTRRYVNCMIMDFEKPTVLQVVEATSDRHPQGRK